MPDLRDHILQLLEMVDGDSETPDLLRVEVKKDPIPLEALDGVLEMLGRLDWGHAEWIYELTNDINRVAWRLHAERGDEGYRHCERCSECWHWEAGRSWDDECPWCDHIAWSLKEFLLGLYPHCKRHRDYMLPCTKRCSRCLEPCHAHPTADCPQAVDRCGHGVWEDEICAECCARVKMFIDGMHKRVVL